MGSHIDIEVEECKMKLDVCRAITISNHIFHCLLMLKKEKVDHDTIVHILRHYIYHIDIVTEKEKQRNFRNMKAEDLSRRQL